MKFEPTTVKGFSDYLPPESLKRAELARLTRESFELYGFIPIETPVIEYDELMRPANPGNEDEAISDRFTLKDKGGRNLGLRYEFTFQLARIFKAHPTIKLPLKRYQIGPIFRDEPLRAGRTREFTQCDVDILGDGSVTADIEVLAAVCRVLEKLGVKFIVQLNNRKLLNAIIESVQIDQSPPVLRALDKLEKIGEDAVKAELKKYADSHQIITLFKLLEKDLPFLVENAFEGASEAQELLELCKQYGIKAEFSPTIVRGFGYYTGNVFEILLEESKTAIAAGGRYDGVVGKFINREIPAVGASFSIEAIMGLCPEAFEKLESSVVPKVLVLSIAEDKESVKSVIQLREKGISCTTWYGKPGKGLEYANAYNIPYVLFIGENEVKAKKLKLKNMQSGEEELLSLKQILIKLK